MYESASRYGVLPRGLMDTETSKYNSHLNTMDDSYEQLGIKPVNANKYDCIFLFLFKKL